MYWIWIMPEILLGLSIYAFLIIIGLDLFDHLSKLKMTHFDILDHWIRLYVFIQLNGVEI